MRKYNICAKACYIAHISSPLKYMVILHCLTESDMKMKDHGDSIEGSILYKKHNSTY